MIKFPFLHGYTRCLGEVLPKLGDKVSARMALFKKGKLAGDDPGGAVVRPQGFAKNRKNTDETNSSKNPTVYG